MQPIIDCNLPSFELPFLKYLHSSSLRDNSYIHLTGHGRNRAKLPINRPYGQQCLAKATIDHTSLWWFHQKLMAMKQLYKGVYRWTAHWLQPSWHEMRTRHGWTEHNVQFFVWHGSQNLCQTTNHPRSISVSEQVPKHTDRYRKTDCDVYE